jgi:NADH-quinone oxidoreductase subunit F
MKQVLERIEEGHGADGDIELLLDLCGTVLGRAFCALGDGATSCVTSSIELFRDEYQAHIDSRACPFDPVKSALFSYPPRTLVGAGRGH